LLGDRQRGEQGVGFGSSRRRGDRRDKQPERRGAKELQKKIKRNRTEAADGRGG
jgi:hypothetical protein